MEQFRREMGCQLPEPWAHMEAPLHAANLPLETMECKGAAKNPPAAAQEGISAPADNTPHRANHTHPPPGSSKVLPDRQQ